MTAGGQVNVTVADGGSATIVVPGANVQLVIGCATGGPVAQVVATRSAQTLQTTFSGGPLVEAAALSVLAGGTVLAMRATSNASGTVRAPAALTGVTSSGATPDVLTKTAHGLTTGDIVTVSGMVTDTAANGTWDITVLTANTFSLNGVTGSASPGTGGTVTPTGIVYIGTGTLAPTITLDGTNGAWDDYYVRVNFIAGGTVGVAGITYQVSLDAGRDYGPTLALGTATTIVIPNSGLTIALTGTQTVVAGDYFTFSTIAPTWNTAGIQACINAFQASQYAIIGVGSAHIVGLMTGANASTIAGFPTSYLETLANNFIYTRAIMNWRDASPAAIWGGTAESETAWTTALLADESALSAKRACPTAAWWNMPSAYPNTVAGAPRYRRSVGWALAAREVIIPPQRHAGRVKDGPLSAIVVDPVNDPLDGFIYHDERINPGLDYLIAGAGGRFSSTMTRQGYPGVYLTNPLLGSALGSDFNLLPKGNVIDVTCSIVRQIGTLFINDDLRLNANGTIYENDARTIEAAVAAQINNIQFATKQISQPCVPGNGVVVSRTWNVQANQSVVFSVQVVGRGYVLSESVTIGFQNQIAAT